MPAKNDATRYSHRWGLKRTAPDASHRLIAVIPAGQGQARRHVVPADVAKQLARQIVRGHAKNGKAVRAYIYDHEGQQVGNV
jgi:hypothetical protein